MFFIYILILSKKTNTTNNNINTNRYPLDQLNYARLCKYHYTTVPKAKQGTAM